MSQTRRPRGPRLKLWTSRWTQFASSCPALAPMSGNRHLAAALAGGVLGENYDRLLAVKGKYDPDGLFFLHHGVGSEDWSADGFTRRN